MCRFYEALYSSNMKENIDIDNYLLNSHVPKITQDDKDFCNSFPSMEECTDAVRNMKLNKSPGLDGLPSEFYKRFWDKIKHLFYDNLNSILENDEMSYTQRLSIITLIHKKGDKNLLKNYRPIRLTNTDYKIIAFVFARRLQKILNNYIGEEQSAYIKGRFIGENARLILDIFDYCENENKDGILLFLDFEKAFDSVEWKFLFKTLESFNFGDAFIKWMKILYKNPLFRLKNNGWISRTCKMTRGIRQGCPISAILYIFVAEILALRLRNNAHITGISWQNSENEIKNIHHADDLTVATKDVKSFENTIKTIAEFCKHAGSKINFDKTECILLGNMKGNYENIFGIKVNTTSVKCLRIHIGHGKKFVIIKIGWKYIIKWKNYLNHGKNENLQYLGKNVLLTLLQFQN